MLLKPMPMDVPPKASKTLACHIGVPLHTCETSSHSAAMLQKSKRQVLTRAEEACQGVVVRLGRVQAGELLFHGCHRSRRLLPLWRRPLFRSWQHNMLRL